MLAVFRLCLVFHARQLLRCGYSPGVGWVIGLICGVGLKLRLGSGCFTVELTDREMRQADRREVGQLDKLTD